MTEKFEKKEITKKSKDFAKWYNDVILKSELADYAPIKGCMVIRPYGYALWEKIQEFLDKLIKEHGVANAYFPIFIPEKFLKLEKEHVEGFSPLFAVVTIAGGRQLKEKLIIRPTSETVMYEMYKKWTKSWRDLPLLINQWNNVVRWEKRTYLFLRTSEFLWQEGHCAHQTHEENMETVLWALDAYQKTYNELMAMYGVAGVKSESEKFAGALRTYTFEMLMPDGKALQGCTSHDLGQNFAKAFNWTVQDKDGTKLYPWQNSWGLSTRSIGGLIMVHGDDNGLVLPPQMAPIQIVIIPIPGSRLRVYEYARGLKSELAKSGFRCLLDEVEGETAGFKYHKWELKGVPVRLEIGREEAEKNIPTAVFRHNSEKKELKIGEIGDLLRKMQNDLFLRHKKFTEENTSTVNSYEEFKGIMKTKRGFIKSFWCEDKTCEEKIKEETKASIRCLPLDTKEEKGKCVYCGKEAIHRWLFAQAY
ncbi:MAG: proline--tRNA ligase [Patescibacteria group bacterium]